ncbi:MAG: type II toxin-antitoxin system VapC family toxin [Acidobacteriota bacterium]
MTRTTRLLLDTHVFLWWRSNDARLGQEGLDAIGTANAVFVSAASAWEAAIKRAIGRLRIPEPFEEGIRDSGFNALPIHFDHAEKVGELPPHHSDPFDRLLVAQAQVEGFTLVTHDRTLASYDVPLIRI